MSHTKLILIALLVAVTGTISVSASVFATVESSNRTEITDIQKQKVAEKKAEIKQRLETAKTQRTEKLTSKKLEICEKRQERINKLLVNATERNTKHLAVFQKIHEKVIAFYTKKNITAEGYTEAAANADEKKAAAIAAIELSNEVTFDCAAADANKPGADIKAAMQSRHTALKEYRTAIKDLILVVKQHNGQNRGTGTDTQTETTPQSETETESTGMEQ